MTEYYDPETYPKEWNYLQPGTIIDQYMIERGLAHGGFSSVYLARQTKDQIPVAIKEYLPRRLAHRTWNNVVIAHNKKTNTLFLKGRALFFAEAKALSKLKHPNIVNVLNFFQANETVYIVMSYDYGLTLDEVIKTQCLAITEQFMLTVFNLLLTGIAVIHEHQMVHLDIKPGNILIRSDNDPLLLDFGALQSFSSVHTPHLAKVLTQGFSPIEQYSVKTPLGPWSDIYALGASMRSCLEGKSPMSSLDRASHDTMPSAVTAFKHQYPEYLLKAIDWAMTIEPENRPQSVQALQDVLSHKTKIA